MLSVYVSPANGLMVEFIAKHLRFTVLIIWIMFATLDYELHEHCIAL